MALLNAAPAAAVIIPQQARAQADPDDASSYRKEVVHYWTEVAKAAARDILRHLASKGERSIDAVTVLVEDADRPSSICAAGLRPGRIEFDGDTPPRIILCPNALELLVTQIQLSVIAGAIARDLTDDAVTDWQLGWYDDLGAAIDRSSQIDPDRWALGLRPCGAFQYSLQWKRYGGGERPHCDRDREGPASAAQMDALLDTPAFNQAVKLFRTLPRYSAIDRMGLYREIYGISLLTGVRFLVAHEICHAVNEAQGEAAQDVCAAKLLADIYDVYDVTVTILAVNMQVGMTSGEITADRMPKETPTRVRLLAGLRAQRAILAAMPPEDLGQIDASIAATNMLTTREGYLARLDKIIAQLERNR